MALPTTDITTTMARNELGASTHKVSELCTHASINQWAKYKPANYGVGNDALSGNQPIGPASGASGYRLGDFRKYDQNAQPPLFFEQPNLDVAFFTDVTEKLNVDDNGIVSINIGAAVTGMRPTATNNGFSPDDLFYKSQNGTIRIRARIWDGSAYVADGTWIELTDPGWDNAVVIVDTSNIDVNSLTGIYDLHGQKQYYNNNIWQEISHRFEGGDGQIEIYVGEKFTITATVSLEGGLTYTITRNKGAGTVDINIQAVVDGGSTYNTTRLGQDEGTYTYAPTRPSDRNIEFIITNANTGYEYRRVQGFVPA